MVLSPRSLPYAREAIGTLLKRSVEDVDLHLITDSASDGRALTEAIHTLQPPPGHRWNVTTEEELDDVEAVRFRGLNNLRAFRKGHPCWRKVTDPLLLSAPGEELVLLDPDVYFPNAFSFEETPSAGLLLMWQRPNCLLPPQVVRAAMDAGVALARHVDIGVSHWRAGSDLEWINWMLGQLAGGSTMPRVMHVEAIVWAAIAMREGGGYLDPALWVCWHRTQGKRLLQKLGADGNAILASENWDRMKCFHAGGEAKWWLPAVMQNRPNQTSITQRGRVLPFIELSSQRYACEQGLKGALRATGYYRMFGARA